MATFRDQAGLKAHLNTLAGVTAESIGLSRNGQPLFAMSFGSGPRNVSIVAGCHADEPVGPMTAQALPAIVREHFPHLLKTHRFFVIPQINPDGADANRPWFDDSPDFATHIQRAVRETPGDDIEFGFGANGEGRPEPIATMAFLREHGPFAAHFSLHGMPFAEGAWFLICREWAGRAAPLMDLLAQFCRHRAVPFHDMDRHGEKGFTRLRPGFSTTPTSEAMRAYFHGRGENSLAARFRPSSMEFAQSISEDPLCMVSEPPLFLATAVKSSPANPSYLQVKKAIEETAQTEDRTAALKGIAQRLGIVPFPLPRQMELQAAMVVSALHFIGTVDA